MEDVKTWHAAKFCAPALGFAIGVTWALGVLILGVVAWRFHLGVSMVQLFSAVYVGFTPTPLGVIVGALWAFVDGFISGFIIAWAYNFCVKHCKCKVCEPKVKVEEVAK